MASASLPYFAYGTLLGARHMRDRYPSAEALGLAFYDRHELTFLRYATELEGGCSIAANSEAILFGVLYRISDEDMARLLAVDGQAHWYEARHIEVTRVAGGRVPAVTLRVNGNRGAWVPPNAYGRLITEGALEANLPEEYRARLNEIVSAAQGRAHSG
jgi:gamma-glutamylcyclotransferase